MGRSRAARAAAKCSPRAPGSYSRVPTPSSGRRLAAARLDRPSERPPSSPWRSPPERSDHRRARAFARSAQQRHAAARHFRGRLPGRSRQPAEERQPPAPPTPAPSQPQPRRSSGPRRQPGRSPRQRPGSAWRDRCRRSPVARDPGGSRRPGRASQRRRPAGTATSPSRSARPPAAPSERRSLRSCAPLSRARSARRSRYPQRSPAGPQSLAVAATAYVPSDSAPGHLKGKEIRSPGRIVPSFSVTVDVPLEPVIATSSAGRQSSPPSSTSVTTAEGTSVPGSGASARPRIRTLGTARPGTSISMPTTVRTITVTEKLPPDLVG